MTVTTNDRGQQNMWAKEPTMTFDRVSQRKSYTVHHCCLGGHNEKAEKLNGRYLP